MARSADKLKSVADELNEGSPGGRCIAIPGDVRLAENCQTVVLKMIEEFGQIDILVNGAGGNFLAQASSLSTNAFRKVQEIDSLGTFHMSKEVFNQAMSKQRQGVIINIGAEIQKNGSALQAHSAAGKASVDALTNVLACEWGPYGIRVVGVIPGGITGTEGMARIANLSNMNKREQTNTASSKTGTDPPNDMTLTDGIPM